MQYNVQENAPIAESILADTTDKLPWLETCSDNTNFLSVASDCFEKLCQRIQKLLVRMMVKEWAQNSRSYTRKYVKPSALQNFASSHRACYSCYQMAVAAYRCGLA